MISNIVKICLVGFVVILASCTSTVDQSEQFSKQIDEINAIHDEIMPRMAELNMLDEVMSDSLNSVSKAQRIPYVAAREKISIADSLMMTWMQNFIPGKERTDEEQAAYLNQELESVITMKAAFLDAIKTAQALTNEK